MLRLGNSSVTVSIEEIQAKIPQYRFLRLISGESGQAGVFEVLNEREAHRVLKLFFPSQDPRRVEAEVQALHSIDHPAFLRAYDCAQVNFSGIPCMYTVMEYISGHSLRDQHNRRIPFSDSELRIFLKSMSEALEILWSRRVVHRDIKPDNILIEDGTQRFVLIDLAYARHLLLPSMTAHSGNPGTLGYKSPEQEAGLRALTVKSDVFSLGVTAYEVRSSQHPYFYQQHLIGRQVPVPLSGVVPGIDISLSNLLAKMMDINPVLRPSPTDIRRMF